MDSHQSLLDLFGFWIAYGGHRKSGLCVLHVAMIISGSIDRRLKMDSTLVMLIPATPCMEYMPISWGGFGGQCRHIWQSHGVSGKYWTTFEGRSLDDPAPCAGRSGHSGPVCQDWWRWTPVLAPLISQGSNSSNTQAILWPCVSPKHPGSTTQATVAPSKHHPTCSRAKVFVYNISKHCRTGKTHPRAPPGPPGAPGVRPALAATTAAGTRVPSRGARWVWPPLLSPPKDAKN